MKPKSTWLDGIEDAHLHRLLSERAARHREGASSFAAATREGGAFVFLRPICTGNDCPDPPLPPHDDPCRGQPYVWQPDLAARLITNEACPTPDSLRRLEQVVAANLSKFKLPDPEVRASCSNQVIDILIWGTRVAPGSCGDAARNRAHIPDDIAANNNFGVYLSAGMIRQLAQQAFDAAPKRLYANGFPGDDGPIHLSGLSVKFEAPNIVKTIITGYDDRPWPDVGFTTTITDHLLEQRGCMTDTDTEPSRFDEILAALFAAVTTAVAVFIPVLMPLPAFVLWTDLHDLSRPDNPSDGGVGCRLMEGLPDQIALPETGGLVATTDTSVMARVRGDVIPQPKKQKLVIPYNQPRVDDRGILVSAFVSIADRVPAASIAGPRSLFLDTNASSTYGYFGAQNEDFFGGRIFSWTGDSNVIIASPNSPATRITFQRGNARPGDQFDRTISVRVTDVEGSTATASLTVTVFVAEPGDSVPPVCKVKPWLDVCSPAD